MPIVRYAGLTPRGEESSKPPRSAPRDSLPTTFLRRLREGLQGRFAD